MKTRTILTTLLPWVGFLSLLLWNGYSLLEQHLARESLPGFVKPYASDLHLKYSTPDWNVFSFKDSKTPKVLENDIDIDQLMIVLKSGSVCTIGASKDEVALFITDQKGPNYMLTIGSRKGVFPAFMGLYPNTGPNRGKLMVDQNMEGVYSRSGGSSTST